MENRLHPRAVAARTCHLVTAAVGQRDPTGQSEPHMSYGAGEGKKFSRIAMGPLQGQGMVKGRFMLVAWLPTIKAYFSRHGKNRTAHTRHGSKYLFPN